MKFDVMVLKMLKRILNPPSQSFFLLGPRGTGKSTWLRALFPDAYVIDLLSEATYQGLLANPGLFANQLRAVPSGKWVVIDEVQRLPALLNEVHRFIEKKQLKFVLCGSSARKLKRAGVNLLAGRALNRAMHPFVPEELNNPLDVNDALQFGLLPIVWDSGEKLETLAAYAQLYLKEEIQAEALVRNLVRICPFPSDCCPLSWPSPECEQYCQRSRRCQNDRGWVSRHSRGNPSLFPSSRL